MGNIDISEMASTNNKSEQAEHRPTPAIQSEFTSSGESEDEGGNEKIVAPKDTGREATLGQYFGKDSTPARERERETQPAQPKGSPDLTVDDRPEDMNGGTIGSTQEQITHDVAEDQQTLEGEDASGQFTRTIRKAQLDSDSGDAE